MGMPNEIVFVRHGQSEANRIQKADKAGEPHEKMEEIQQRPDWEQRLTPEGIEQAKMAKLWINQNLGGAASFDLRYATKFMRGRETAAYVGGEECDGWKLDDRLIERDWGHYGAVPEKVRQKKYRRTKQMYDQSPWYTRLDNGQSRSDITPLLRDFLDTMHREAEGKRVLVVTHGDFMGNVRYNLEGMLPEEFKAMEDDKTQTIGNACLLIYRRMNPYDETDVREHVRWRRMINPVFPELSPFDGEWVELPPRPKYTGAQLLQQVEYAPRLLTE